MASSPILTDLARTPVPCQQTNAPKNCLTVRAERGIRFITLVGTGMLWRTPGPEAYGHSHLC
eukprot:5700466-Amphidinium_carterae.1